MHRYLSAGRDHYAGPFALFIYYFYFSFLRRQRIRIHQSLIPQSIYLYTKQKLAMKPREFSSTSKSIKAQWLEDILVEGVLVVWQTLCSNKYLE